MLQRCLQFYLQLNHLRNLRNMFLVKICDVTSNHEQYWSVTGSSRPCIEKTFTNQLPMLEVLGMEGMYMFVHISIPLSKLRVVGHGCRDRPQVPRN